MRRTDKEPTFDHYRTGSETWVEDGMKTDGLRGKRKRRGTGREVEGTVFVPTDGRVSPTRSGGPSADTHVRTYAHPQNTPSQRF